MSNKEKVERIKTYLKKDQPKVTKKHFDWSQFYNLYKLEYNKEKDSYEAIL